MQPLSISQELVEMRAAEQEGAVRAEDAPEKPQPVNPGSETARHRRSKITMRAAMEGPSGQTVGEAAESRLNNELQQGLIGEWQPEGLESILSAIGAVKHRPAHPSRDSLVKQARQKWLSGKLVHGIDSLNEAEPSEWAANGYLVFFGDGSAKESRLYRPMELGLHRGTRKRKSWKRGSSQSHVILSK